MGRSPCPSPEKNVPPMMRARAATCLATLATATTLVWAPGASAKIHPMVESFDCANAKAFENHQLGDVAGPPGQTPRYGQHSDRSSLAGISAVTKGLSDFSSPALFGHKLDGQCGHAGSLSPELLGQRDPSPLRPLQRQAPCGSGLGCW